MPNFALTSRTLLDQANSDADAGVFRDFSESVERLAAAARAAGITVFHQGELALSCQLSEEAFLQLFGFRVDPQRGYSGACRIAAPGCEALDYLEVYPPLQLL